MSCIRDEAPGVAMPRLDYEPSPKLGPAPRRWVRRHRRRLLWGGFAVLMAAACAGWGPAALHHGQVYRLQRNCRAYAPSPALPVWTDARVTPRGGTVVQRCAAWDDLLAATGAAGPQGTFLVGSVVGPDGDARLVALDDRPTGWFVNGPGNDRASLAVSLRAWTLRAGAPFQTPSTTHVGRADGAAGMWDLDVPAANWFRLTHSRRSPDDPSRLLIDYASDAGSGTISLTLDGHDQLRLAVTGPATEVLWWSVCEWY